MTDGYVFRGDFRIIKLDGMFHVVFRPDAQPEWFRIIASFFTYERAYSYCDLERVMSFDGDGETSEEIKDAAREPPSFVMPNPEKEFGVPEMVRNLLFETNEAVSQLPVDEELNEQPRDQEEPQSYRERIREASVRALPTIIEATAAGISSAADEPQPEPPITASAEPLGAREAAVLKALSARANHMGIASASQSEIAAASDVPSGSIPPILQDLESRGFIKRTEKGTPGRSSLYRVNPTCVSCGTLRSGGSAKQCRACYELKAA
jgi:hypothetical protein